MLSWMQHGITLHSTAGPLPARDAGDTVMAQRARHNLIAATAAAAGPCRGRTALAVSASLALGAALGACSGGGSINIANSQSGDPATLDYPIFYVKRTV